jgi:hypothetical protein
MVGYTWSIQYCDFPYADNYNNREELLKRLAKPEHLPAWRRLFYKFSRLTGMANIYWDRQLKENNAFEKRFDRPFT